MLMVPVYDVASAVAAVVSSLTQQWNPSRRPVSQPPREGASFGKFVGLRLEVNYMKWLPINNGAACNSSARARETNADL
jgi:hypothetical protein